MVRQGFSFIELVVSIVVIGIVFLSVPLILSETEKSSELAIQQEAVMAGMTQLVNTMSYRWDEGQTDESNNSGYAKVLDTQNGASALQCIDFGGSRWRRGHFREANRRRCYNPPIFANTIGPDGDDLDDVDDIVQVGLVDRGDANASIDYKKDYNITLNVNYISDTIFNYNQTILTGSISATSAGTNAASSTNIKMITATINSANNERVVLRSFVTNIGEYKIYSKYVQ